MSISSMEAAFGADTAVALIIEPDNGMTAASAPAAGSQAIIHINSSFRNGFMFIVTRLMPIGSTVTVFYAETASARGARRSSSNHRYSAVGNCKTYHRPAGSGKVKCIFTKSQTQARARVWGKKCSEHRAKWRSAYLGTANFSNSSFQFILVNELESSPRVESNSWEGVG